MRRRDLLAALAAAPLLARALSVKRLGMVAAGKREDALAFHASTMAPVLADFGWIEGRTLEMVWGFDEGDEARIPALAKQVVEARPDVIACAGTARTRAFQQATRTIPIFTAVGDPVGAGFAKSLARPGGNITGLSYSAPEINVKQVELLRMALPRLQAVAFIATSKWPTGAEFAKPSIARLREDRIDARFHSVATFAEYQAVLRALPKGGRSAAVLYGRAEDLGAGNMALEAIDLRVALCVPGDDLVERGALFSYGLFHEDERRRRVAIIDKLLRGADPATIPFELPTKSRFVINRRTAAALGIVLPPEFALRADRVIE